MPVRYTPPSAGSLLPVSGVALGAAAGRIKSWQRNDVLLVTFEPGTIAAGVFTQNRFCAAPVIVCREHLAEEAGHRTGGHVRATLDGPGRLDESLGGGIKFEDGKAHGSISFKRIGTTSFLWAGVLQMLVKRLGKLVETRAVTPGAEKQVRRLCRERNRSQRLRARIGDRRRR